MTVSIAAVKKEKSLKLFNRADRFPQGWYWALPSRNLKPGRARGITLIGRDLVLYRNEQGEPVAMDAYCPHAGAALAGGKVKQGKIQCPLHGRQFDERGHCTKGADESSVDLDVQRWPTAERYGLIWVWAGELTNDQLSPSQVAAGQALPELPSVPELSLSSTRRKCSFHLSNAFSRKCHPNVVLINAIDANHFNSVHDLPLEIRFETKTLSHNAVQFSNTTRGGEASRFVRFIRPWYKNAVTYQMCYWYGSTGTVTLGPDFLHFYLMFALRPAANGTTEGWTILLTPERAGALGWMFSRAVLGVTQLVANYFAKGDREVFDSIRFDFKTPLAADSSISQFVKHVEQQKAIAWKTWRPIS